MPSRVALLLLLCGCDFVFLGEERPVIPPDAGPVFRTITITPSSNVLPIAEFPVSITTDADASLAAHALPDGKDIYFTNEQDLDLPFERVAYQDGTLEAWVLVTIDGPTKIRMHYGGAIVAQSTEVWARQNIASYHLGTDTNDSTPNGHHLMTMAGQPATVPGVVGTGRHLTEELVCERICAPVADTIMLRDSSFSYAFWIEPGARLGQYDMPVYAGGASATLAGFDLEIADAGWSANLADGALHTQLQLASTGSGWSHVAVVYRKGPMELLTYLNGQLSSMMTTPAFGTITARNICLGGPDCYSGGIDEVRVYGDSKEARWITAEYENVKKRDTFVTIGDEQVSGQ